MAGRRGSQACVVSIVHGNFQVEVGRPSSTPRSALSPWSANENAPQQMHAAAPLHMLLTTATERHGAAQPRRRASPD